MALWSKWVFEDGLGGGVVKEGRGSGFVSSSWSDAGGEGGKVSVSETLHWSTGGIVG